MDREASGVFVYLRERAPCCDLPTEVLKTNRGHAASRNVTALRPIAGHVLDVSQKIRAAARPSSDWAFGKGGMVLP